MNLCGMALSPEEADELLVQCDQLAELMSLWRKRSAEVQHAVQDLSALTGLTPRRPIPRPRLCPGNAERQSSQPESQSPPSAAGAESTPARPQSSHREVREAVAPSIFHWNQPASQVVCSDLGESCRSQSKDADSDSSDSDTFELDVDDAWTQRLRDLDQDSDSGGEAEDEPAVPKSPVFAFLGRTAPVILERIDEGAPEDCEASSSSSSCSGSSPADEASDSSRDSSVERAWANVPEVGYGSTSLSSGVVVATAAAAAPADSQPLSAMPSPAADCKRNSTKAKEQRRRGHASLRRQEQYRQDKPVKSGISEVPASWRSRRGCPGPKDEGPLSRIAERGGASSTE